MIISTKIKRLGAGLALALGVSVLTTGCIEDKLTSTLSLQVVGTDDAAVSYTSAEGGDPTIGAVYRSTTENSITGVAGMNVAYYGDKQTDGTFSTILLLTFVPNGTDEVATYSTTGTDVSAAYQASGVTYTTLSDATPATITVSQYGDVGGLVEGTYDVTLCNVQAILNCTDTDKVQLKGSFSAVRATDK